MKLLFLDQAELAAEDQKRHDSVIVTLSGGHALKKPEEKIAFFFRLKLDTLQAQLSAAGTAYCLIQAQAQGRLTSRPRWTPQRGAADLGAQTAQRGAADCWTADAEWSAWSGRCRSRVDFADCRSRIHPSPSARSRGGSPSATGPIGLRARKKKITWGERWEKQKANSFFNTGRWRAPTVTHQCRGTPPSRSDRG